MFGEKCGKSVDNVFFLRTAYCVGGFSLKTFFSKKLCLKIYKFFSNFRS